ncbi:hypothetical protein PanWU01x14_319450 [Parasponia andersonii]|uniref:Uncharacterized protein n=1 Tax=Parasponia andersonii TaxID=3476 RepID=A0A2P5AM07_PARAD|nr:hypothetical protein PanWU01x14_319450 [Parasponia andersonii]
MKLRRSRSLLAGNGSGAQEERSVKWERRSRDRNLATQSGVLSVVHYERGGFGSIGNQNDASELIPKEEEVRVKDQMLAVGKMTSLKAQPPIFMRAVLFQMWEIPKCLSLKIREVYVMGLLRELITENNIITIAERISKLFEINRRSLGVFVCRGLVS